LSGESKEIGIGLLGYGETGRRHARAWHALPFIAGAPRIRLVAVADPDSDAAELAVEEAGFEWIASSPDELIAHPAVHAVDVCTPATEHAMALRRAMAAGKHICCVAPLAYTLREAEEIAGLAGRTEGVKFLATAFRHLPPLTLARELMDAGFVGELRRFHIRRVQGFTPDADGVAALPADDIAAVCVLPHVLDLARALAGDVREVFAAFAAVDSDGIPAAQTVAALLRYADGGEGTLEACAVTNGLPDSLEVELAGSQGAIRYTASDPDSLHIFDATAAPSVRGWKTLPTGDSGADREAAVLLAFVQAIEAGGPAIPGFRDALMLHRMADAMRQSAEAGGWRAMDSGR
jgi:predicted dehydrogenase